MCEVFMKLAFSKNKTTCNDVLNKAAFHAQEAYCIKFVLIVLGDKSIV
jgi:hypothetical protein